MNRKEKNTLHRLLAQSEACFLNWIFRTNSELMISNPVLEIKEFHWR